MSRSPRSQAVLFVVFVLLSSCSGGEPEKRASGRGTPSPSPSAKKEGLCQPFPDRLVDGFVAAYNGRNLETLEDLVTASPIEDVVAAAYANGSSFDDVGEWAEAGWAAGDHMKLSGYGAFYPTKRGFQMYMSRSSATLRDRGIERVYTTLDAISDGCTIASLVDSGPIQAKGRPCAFYDAFAIIDEVAADEPQACIEGTADHARSDPAAVYTGEGLLVWGGHRGGYGYSDMALDGLAFHPASERWTPIPELLLPAFRPEVSVWTGKELIVLGAKSRADWSVVGGAYNPQKDTWRTIPFPFSRGSEFEGVWTGQELLLWGGPRSEKPPRHGLAYNPSTGSWRRTSPAPIGGRWSHSVAWTGSELIMWGGSDPKTDLADGAAYDPITDTWRKIAPAPLPARQRMPITWTGTEVIVWGGSSYSRNRADGAAYNPATDSWRKLAPAPLKGRHYHSATWTGTELIVFGGYDYHRSFSDGAAYDPATDSWRKLPRAPIKRRFNHSSTWTGTELIVFGGMWDFGHIALGDGAIYDPARDRWWRLFPSF